MNVTRDHLFKKVYGCLMGVACGDAMGMPSSMFSPALVRKHFPDGINKFEPAPVGHPIHANLVAGQVTDDTLQTLILTHSILEDGEVNPLRFAQRILEWVEASNGFQSNLLGPSSLRALQALRDGKNIKETGMFGDTNGAAMRIAPVGIINGGDIEHTIFDVQKSCLATHNTNIAIAGASAIACAIGTALNDSTTIENIIGTALTAADRGMTFGNPWIGASISRRILFALEIVKKAESKEQLIQDLYDLVGTSVAMTETVPVSFAILAYAKGDPVEAIHFGANLGGDADTISAIVGAMSGAVAGIDAFPQQYISTIEQVNKLDLKNVAGQLTDFIVSRSNSNDTL